MNDKMCKETNVCVIFVYTNIKKEYVLLEKFHLFINLFDEQQNIMIG